MKDLLILDFDGVVLKADELFYQIAKDNFFINRSDRYPISKVRMSEVISTGGEKLFKAVIGRENFTKDDVNIFRKAQVDCFNKENHLFSVLSDIENIYNDYKNGICICSNKPDWIIKEILIKRVNNPRDISLVFFILLFYKIIKDFNVFISYFLKSFCIFFFQRQ